MAHDFIVHCDGAAAPTNPGPSAIGVVVHKASDQPPSLLNEISEFLGRGTNQTAELTAAIRGLEHTPIGASVLLVSDSKYVVQGLTEWIISWKKNGWRTSNKKPVANKDLWVKLVGLYEERSVDCQWVRGHSGHVWNERCDELATLALIQEGVITTSEEQPGS